MRILLVDDDRELRDPLAEALARRGHAVQTAADGAMGLQAFYGGSFDAVISDWNMPHLNGFQMVTEILKLVPKQRVVMISGDGSNKPPEGVPLLAKPFRIQELLDALV